MFATVLHGPRDVRYEHVDEPKILKPTDAVIKLSATCICGSDLWPYRGLQSMAGPTAMGHEYCGVVVEIGISVKTLANWIRLARDGGLVSDGKRRPVSDLEAENAKLRAENAQLRMERDFLKKTTAFFAKESR